MITVQHNLDRLNRDIALYVDLTGLTVEDALIKHGNELGFALRRTLRGIAPAKGSLRAQAMELLKSGRGVRVRPSIRERVYKRLGVRVEIEGRRTVFGRGRRAKASTMRRGRRLNLQALAVQAEIGARESGRGFLSVSSGIPRFARRHIHGSRLKARSRYGPTLMEAGITARAEGRSVVFEWGGFSAMSGSAATGLTKAKAQRAVAEAIELTALNIEQYLSDKLDRNFERSFR